MDNKFKGRFAWNFELVVMKEKRRRRIIACKELNLDLEFLDDWSWMDSTRQGRILIPA